MSTQPEITGLGTSTMSDREVLEVVVKALEAQEERQNELERRVEELETRPKRTVNRRPDELGERIIRLLEKHATIPFTASTIAETLDVEEGPVHSRLPTLAKRGYVLRVEREGRRPVYKSAPGKES